MLKPYKFKFLEYQLRNIIDIIREQNELYLYSSFILHSGFFIYFLPIFFQLYYLRLPKDIKDYMVILMDATVATGAAAMMAIRVLLDHDVPEENILIVSLLMAESGIISYFRFKLI